MKNYLKNIIFINDIYTRLKWRQQRISYGKENIDKTFYVIRRANSKVGMFSLIMTTVGHIKYAVDKGYIPVVDLSSGSLQGNKGEKLDNIWEVYFEQPCGYGMEDIRKSKNVILSNGIIDNRILYPGGNIAHDIEALQTWKGIAKKYLIVKENIRKEADEMARELFSEKKILGVLMRGTDYVNARPPLHPVQPTVQQVINKVDEVLEEYKCKYIYVVTEDENIFRQLNQKYGKKIISLNMNRYTTQGKQNINDIRRENEKNICMQDKQYLISILLLAKCHCLVAGNAGGTQGALLFNDNYEFQYIYDLGIY